MTDLASKQMRAVPRRSAAAGGERFGNIVRSNCRTGRWWKRIMRTYTCVDFKQALAFVNRAGDVARSRDIIRIFCWGRERRK